MPETIPLWPATAGDVPGDTPTLTIHLATAAPTGAMVMVCPGGGYQMLADHEGPVIAQWLNSQGFHAAVLRYRLGPRHRHPAMIHDAQRGLRILRHRAADWGVDPHRIAVLGFSAGGHLASTLAVHHDHFTSGDDDLAPQVSARPDAAVLCYAVIDMGEFRHDGSRQNLLGPKPDAGLVAALSNHTQVTPDTPPAFLWHTADDAAVPVEGALLFAAACRRHRVPVEVHVFDQGAHGLGLASGHPAASWSKLCAAFLRRHLTKA